MLRRYRFLISCTLYIAVGLFMVGVSPVLAQNAQDTFRLNEFAQTTALGGTDLRIVVANIIRVILGSLGLIALCIILYAGWRYMTAAGNEEQTEESKKIIVNATIGLAIILSSFIIVQFVISKLSSATGSGSVGGDGGGVPAVCVDPGYALAHPAECSSLDFDCANNAAWCAENTAFVVKSITPQTADTNMNNAVIRIVFSRPVGTPADKVAVITQGGKNISDQFTFQFVPGSNDQVLEAEPRQSLSDSCGVNPEQGSGGGGVRREWDGRKCLPKGMYTVQVQNSIVTDRSGNKLQLRVNKIDFNFDANFQIQPVRTLDTIAPVISQVILRDVDKDYSNPRTISLPRGRAYTIFANVTDKTGISYVRLVIENKSGSHRVALYDGPRQTSNSPYAVSMKSAIILPSDAQLRDEYTVRLTAYDIDHNESTEMFKISIIGSHCTNGVKDGDETGVDLGGSCSLTDGCRTDNECATGVCDVKTNLCVPFPQITDVSPWNGAVGNWISVSGQYFGTDVGDVEFGYDTDNNQVIDDKDQWLKATVVSCGTQKSWTDSQVIVSVPAEPAYIKDALRPDNPILNKRAIRITRNKASVQDALLRDSTVDEQGPRPGPDRGLFTVNTIKRPGLCSVQTGGGEKAATPKFGVFAIGTGFGASPVGDSRVSFGGFNGVLSQWSANSITTAVPAGLSPSTIAVTVTVDGVETNGVRFTVLSEQSNVVPIIRSVDPDKVTRLSYLTVRGEHFGEEAGTVYLAKRDGDTCVNPDATGCVRLATELPSACGDTWSDRQIMAQIPKDTPLNTVEFSKYYVVVRDALHRPSQGNVQVVVDSGEARPSICALSPSAGPAPLAASSQGLTLVGVNFSSQPTVYFWRKGARGDDFSTWLSSVDGRFAGNPVLRNASDSQIVTHIPVTDSGYTMETGPIKVFANGQASNGVWYTVQDCRAMSSLPDKMQCCKKGPDAGILRPETQLCAGETRNAGYVWRFTTGQIPHVPTVVESCSETDWANPQKIVDFPSPTPWKETKRGVAACLNSTIAAQFTLDMDESTINQNTVKLFTCADGVNNLPDCSRKIQIASDQLVIAYKKDSRTVTVQLKKVSPELAPNTWYRVELGNTLKSKETVTLFGISKVISQPLAPTRACGSGAAYCFEFRTGNGRCELIGAGITPSSYTSSVLGPVMNPIGSASPVYFSVWGKGNQECSVLPVDGLGWVWSTANAAQASVKVAPGNGIKDSRATATALADTGASGVQIRASYAGKGQETVTQSTNRVTEITSVTEANVTDLIATEKIPTPFRVYAWGDAREVAPRPEYNFLTNATMTIRVALDPFTPAEFDAASNKLDRMLSFRNAGWNFSLTDTRDPKDGSISRAVLLGYQGKNPVIGGNAVLVRLTPLPFDVTNAKPGEVTTYDVAQRDNKVFLYQNGILLATGNRAFQDQSANNNKLLFGTNARVPAASMNLKGVYEAITFTGPDKVVEKTTTKDVLTTETIITPVGGITATGTLFVTLADPKVEDYWPKCAAACTNAQIGVRFNRPMVTSTYLGQVSMRPCTDDTCTQFLDGGDMAVTLTEAAGHDDPYTYTLLPQQTLRENQWYLVQVTDRILSVGQWSPLRTGKSIAAMEWKFKTRATDGVCGVSSVAVVPHPFTAYHFGEKTKYVATPYSAPDSCSPNGQALDPWQYGWSWDTEPQGGDAKGAVALVTQFSTSKTASPFCSLQCLPLGGDVARGQVNDVLCGNGVVDPGEDCDLGVKVDGQYVENPGVSCTFSCLRPGNLKKGATGEGYCGNGQLDTNQGEECDPKDSQIGKYCTDTCTWKVPSKVAIKNDVDSPICGDGVRSVRAGVAVEDCDASVPAGDGVNVNARCTPDCVHAGTTLSRAWCTDYGVNSKRQVTDACRVAKSVCGNGIKEANEECEVGLGGATEATCNSRCLIQNACNTPLEQCRANDPSGACNADCTRKGSSVTYTTPSLCGDGVVGTGESALCESVSESGNNVLGQNPIQVVTAVGAGDVVNQSQKTKITASVVKVRRNQTVEVVARQVTGRGDYVLQCGYEEYATPKVVDAVTTYNNCPNATSGVATNSCCYPRPAVIATYPKEGSGLVATEGPVCRNTLIQAVIDGDISVDSLQKNVILARFIPSGTCRPGETNITDQVVQFLAVGTETAPVSWWYRWFGRIRTLLGLRVPAVTAVDGANAISSDQVLQNIWCTGSIKAVINASTEVISIAGGPMATSTRVSVGITSLLEPTTKYAVIVRGGQAGVVDTRGVGLANRATGRPWYMWAFKTGADICKIEKVSITPAKQLFNLPNQAVSFTATALGKNGSKLASIPDVYSWSMSWGPRNHPVFAIPTPNTAADASVVRVSSRQREGQATLAAVLKVDADIDQTNNQKGRVFSGSSALTASFCEHPWPSRDPYPFEDRVYNFSFGYCADAGVSGKTNDDLPFLRSVPLTDRKDGELIKTLFVADGTNDAIGLRLFGNAGSTSAREWYTAKFGTDVGISSVSVAGYDAVTDGHTYYINFLNRTDDGRVFNNILVLTLNADAGQQMRQVYDKIVQSLTFNTNLTDVGSCLLEGKNLLTDSTSVDVNQPCANDFSCRDTVTGAPSSTLSGVCSNARTKFLRDWQRLHDIRNAQEKIEQYKNKMGDYPSLESGTFYPNYTAAFWPSWNRLSQDVGGLPTDPVNKKVSCKTGNTEDATCWNSTDSKYTCPAYSSVYEYTYDRVAHTYLLHNKFEFFDLDDPIVAQFINTDRFTTAPGCTPTQIYSPFTQGIRCGDGVVSPGEQCDPPGSVIAGLSGNFKRSETVTIPGECAVKGPGVSESCTTNAECPGVTYSVNRVVNAVTGVISLSGTGNKTDYVISNGKNRVCGIETSVTFQSGVRPVTQLVRRVFYANKSGVSKAYLFGCDTNTQCRTADYYRDQLPSGGEEVVSVAPPFLESAGLPSTFSLSDNIFTETDLNPQSIEGQLQGYIRCLTTASVFSNTRSVANQCQNVRQEIREIDGSGICPDTGQVAPATCTSQCQIAYGQCAVRAFCGNGRVEVGERCDDGGLNGGYGQCNATCSGLAAAYCGNGTKEANEFCDWSVEGSGVAKYNPNKNLSCAWNCQAPGEYCGDGAVQTNVTPAEQCEGDTKELLGACKVNGQGAIGWQGNGGNIRAVGADELYAQGPTTFQYQFRVNKGTFVLGIDTYNYSGGATMHDLTGPTLTEANGGSAGVAQTVCLGTPGVQHHIKVYVDKNHDGDFADAGESIGELCQPAVDKDVRGLQHANVTVGQLDAGSYTFSLVWDNDWNHPTGGWNMGDSNLAIAGVTLNAQSYRTCNTASCQWDTAPLCEALTGATTAAPGGCGDGVKQDAEACDLGALNGIRCTPSYGRTCTYCALACNEVLTVDPVGACGNGKIDQIATKPDGTPILEACDVSRSGSTETVVSSTPVAGNLFATSVPVCEDKGQFTCSNDCRKLVSSCVSCTVADNRGAIPKVAVLNVLTPTRGDNSNWLPNTQWGAEVYKGLFRKGTDELLGVSNWGWAASGPVIVDPNGQPVANPDSGFVSFQKYVSPQWLILAPNGFPSDPAYVRPFKGLESNVLCKNEYQIQFASRAHFSNTPVRMIPETVSSIFSYPVDGESTVIENELVMTPAVPPLQVRVVIRWPKDEDNIQLAGLVYNQDFLSVGASDTSGPDKTYGLMRAFAREASGEVCRAMRISGPDGNTLANSYWIPDCNGYGLKQYPASDPQNYMRIHYSPRGFVDPSCPDCSYEFSMYAHDIGTLNTVAAQATTINLNANHSYQRPYAFVVQGLSGPVGLYRNKDVFVDVYIGGKGGESRYYVHKPDYTFSLRAAAETSSNPQARYWHVFDIIPRIVQAGSAVQLTGMDINTSITGVNGSIETDWQGVLENYSRE